MRTLVGHEAEPLEMAVGPRDRDEVRYRRLVAGREERERPAGERRPATATERSVGVDPELREVERPADAEIALRLVRVVVRAQQVDRDVRGVRRDVAIRRRVTTGLVVALDGHAGFVHEDAAAGRHGADHDLVRTVAQRRRIEVARDVWTRARRELDEVCIARASIRQRPSGDALAGRRNERGGEVRRPGEARAGGG